MGLRIQVDPERIIDVPPEIEAAGAEEITAYVRDKTGIDVDARRREHQATIAAAAPVADARDERIDDRDDVEEA